MRSVGKLMFVADTLSRAVDPTAPSSGKLIEDIQAYVNMIVEALPVADSKMKLIYQETEQDQTLTQVKFYVMNGWPDVKQDCVVEVHEFWNCKSDLSVCNGILYKGNKIVIPKNMRREMLNKIHEGHLGIEKCKKRAREVMYWPGINQDITIEVSKCQTCARYQFNNPREPLKSHPVPERPYQKVGADIFTCHGKNYLLVTDYYSFYPEVCALSTTTAENVISCLKSVFARHGVPTEVFTDNGPQFVNDSFQSFSKDWDFRHTTSSPYFPQSNGLVEKSVGVVKRLMQKANDYESSFYMGLLAYRSTPLECGNSPAYLLMGRRLRSNLPMSEDLLVTEGSKKFREFKEQQKAKQKVYYDKGTHHLPELRVGEEVRFKDKTNTWNQKGIVLEQIQPRSYNVETTSGVVFRRNRQHLLKDLSAESEQPEQTEIPLRRSVRERRCPERLIETC
ncbi:uncharacterized protein K02A2.6-like [Rhinichthys klamathensis goyatoka]|uniref:uncharacterized protein K02A2.6-like n=1 Tax=Rhinichthys klamathensis goyatoka TaxID=3034132 RepID=UPI0024B5814B|nr:uncharacterized protein K02A2.6-like [Rhinichthys klamathensis goyatoka]